MPECGLPLPCENTIASDGDALQIFNNGNGGAIAAIATNGPGVRAISNGVAGPSFGNDVALSGTGNIRGVSGESVDGVGVVGVSDNNSGVAGQSTRGNGVFGITEAVQPFAGVHGQGTGIGVSGQGTLDGVFGQSGAGFGVRGESTSGAGVSGSSVSGAGVNGSSVSGAGVSGSSVSGTGVFGGSAGGTLSVGVRGNSAGGALSIGVLANSGGGSNSIGVLASRIGGTGVVASGGFRAGLFRGDVQINGVLSKLSGGFRIDHPLDPAHKYFSHSFVESSEMKNVYDGVVTLDEHGECRVELPEWFEAINCDLRYQLTSIGEPAPNLHVSQEISNNHFNIAGGKSRMKV